MWTTCFNFHFHSNEKGVRWSFCSSSSIRHNKDGWWWLWWYKIVVHVCTFSGTCMHMQVQVQVPVAQLGFLDSCAKHTYEPCHIHKAHGHFL
jgi:hypothetical protein